MKAPQRAMVAGALRQQMANALRRLRQPASIEQATRALRTLIEQTPWRWRRATLAALLRRLGACEAERALRMQDPLIAALAGQAFEQSAAHYAVAGRRMASWHVQSAHTLAWLDWMAHGLLAGGEHPSQPPRLQHPMGWAQHPMARALDFAVACQLGLPVVAQQPEVVQVLSKQARQAMRAVGAGQALSSMPLRRAWWRALAMWLSWRAKQHPSRAGGLAARCALRHWRLGCQPPSQAWQQAMVQTLWVVHMQRRYARTLKLAQAVLLRLARYPGLKPDAVWDLLCTCIDVALDAGLAGHAHIVSWTGQWIKRAPRTSRTAAMLALQQANSAAHLALRNQPAHWCVVEQAAEVALGGGLAGHTYLQAHAHRWRALALWARVKSGQPLANKALVHSARQAMAVFADVDDAGRWAELSVLLLLAQTHERAHGGARVPAPGGSAEAWLPLVQTVERRLNEPSLCMPRRMASRASSVKA